MGKIINLLVYRIDPHLKPKITNRGVGLMLNKEQLEKLSKADIETIDKSNLYDVTVLDMDISESILRRSEQFFDLVKNPYTLKVGDVGVKVNFGNGKSFSDSIMDVVMNPNCH